MLIGLVSRLRGRAVLTSVALVSTVHAEAPDRGGAEQLRLQRLVSVSIRRIEGVAVESLQGTVSPHAQIEGDVVNLPEEASIWLVTRTLDGQWLVRDNAAVADRGGAWWNIGSALAHSGQEKLEVDLFAIAAFARPEMPKDGTWPQESMLDVSRPVRIRVGPTKDPDKERPSVAVDHIHGEIVRHGAPVVVPDDFEVKGRAAHLPSADGMAVALLCGDRWRVLDRPTVDKTGEWTVPHVSLGSIPPGETCQLMAIVDGGSLRTGSRYRTRRLRSVATATSNVVSIRRSPSYLAISKIATDSGDSWWDGKPLAEMRGPVTEVKVSAMAIPERARLWLLTRSLSEARWLAFGPARQVSPIEWNIDNAWLRSPERNATRFVLMAVASADDLLGRQMTEHDLQKTVLVASAPVRIALAAPQAKPAAAISIDTINGRPAAIDRVIDLHDEIAIVEGEHSALETPNTIWLGINTFRDERWTFHRAETVEGEASRWRASIQLPRGRRISGPDGLNAEMVAIVAPGMLGAGQVQRDWSDSFIVAKSSPALLHLSEEPWGANLLSSITSTLALPTFDSFGLASVVLPPWEDWLFPLFGALLAILLLRRASLRARWSGFRDGRKNVPHAGAPQPGPAEVEIMATVDARLQRRLQPIRSKCAHLKAQFDVYQITHERHLLEYDRLRRKPEQYFFRPGWAPWMRHTILLLLTVGELFFNTSAFEVIGKDRVGTLIMALGLGIAIPVCAYVLGIAVASYEVEPRKATGLKIFIYAFALVLALLGISWIRGRSMAYDAVFAREGLSGAGGEAIGAFTTWDIPIIYFIFNLLIVIAAAALAYAAADARGDAAEATRRTQSLENRLANLRSGLQRLKTKEASLRARADRESRRLIALYRSTNLRWRKSEAPAHFWAPMTAIVIADEPAESPIASAAHRGNGGSDGIKTEMPV